MLRRLTYLMTVWYVATPTLQMLSLIGLNLTALVYLGHVRPFQTRWQNYYEWYCQLSIILVTTLMLTYTDWVGDRGVQSSYGVAMIIIISLHMLITVVLIYYWIVRQGLLLINWFIMWIKWKCTRPIVNEPEKVHVGFSATYLLMQ